MDKNLSIIKGIYWLNIFILEELHEFLRGSDLKELSLVSQLFRAKLKPQLFKYIILEYNSLSTDIYYFGLSNSASANLSTQKGIRRYKQSELHQPCLNKYNYKTLVIDPYLRSMKGEFEVFSTLVKRFRFHNLYQPCYYLINLAELAINLTSLDIDTGFLLFKEFQIILKGSQCLEELVLSNITFVKFNTDKLPSNELSFPKSLQKLTIYPSWLIERHFRKGAYQLLFGGFSIFPIPLPIKIENLPNLEYFNYTEGAADSPFLPCFVELNPQIRYLRIPLKDFAKNHTELTRPDYRVIDTFQDHSNSINQIIENVYFTGLKFITKFEFHTILGISDLLLKRFLTPCKNLKNLKIPLDITRSYFIQRLVSQIASLRSLCINSSMLLQSKNEFLNTISAKYIILALHFEFADKIMLTAQTNLREIFFKFKTDQWDINYGKEIAQRNEGWGFSIRNNYTKWYR